MANLNNKYLLDYIGKTATENNLLDCKKFLLENKSKCLGYIPRPNIISLVHTENNNEIITIGGSEPLDILSDNFLKLFSSQWRSPSTAQLFVSLKDITNSDFDFGMWYSLLQSAQEGDFIKNMYITNIGGINQGIQLGKGSTDKNRQDVNIESPFTNGGLEDQRNIISSPVYSSALATLSMGMSFNATGSGIISESVLMNRFRSNVGIKTVLISSDLISPVVSFISSQSVFTEYVLAI